MRLYSDLTVIEQAIYTHEIRAWHEPGVKEGDLQIIEHKKNDSIVLCDCFKISR